VVHAEALSPDAHPRSALLVVEVAGESLRFDRYAKAAIYAAAGIPEYWIFDIEGRRVEVYCDVEPSAAKYRSVRTLEPDARLDSRAVPALSLPLALVFG
jgi:Uma2 family endonuclease